MKKQKNWPYVPGPHDCFGGIQRNVVEPRLVSEPVVPSASMGKPSARSAGRLIIGMASTPRSVVKVWWPGYRDD